VAASIQRNHEAAQEVTRLHLSGPQRRALFERMLLIRRFEEAVLEAAPRIPGPYHVYIGQEAVGAGVIGARRAGDQVATNHRNHGHLLACGSDPRAVMAEIMGKATGTNRGKSGSMHVCDRKAGVLVSSPIVAAGVGVAVGAAYAMRYSGDDSVAIALFGDGALCEGSFYESVNLAALWKLPVVLVCENNSGQPVGADNVGGMLATRELRRLVDGFAIETAVVDGLDAEAMWQAAAHAMERARAGGGPSFIEARLVPWPGNAPWNAPSHPDTAALRLDVRVIWQPESAVVPDPWYALHDPVVLLGRSLLASGEATSADLVTADERCRTAAADALRFADDSPYPEAAEAYTDVFRSGESTREVARP
jgi:TPP-dependent pyruvate/acetoin dehydrogenase alpha subunit